MTGKKNARLRLEHSAKQEEYMNWLYDQLKNLFTKKPVYLERVHPRTKNVNRYHRLQSQSSPFFGKLRRKFYDEDGKKIIPEDIEKYLKYARTLAVWYMDDGYYYKRDKSAHIYIPKYSEEDLERLVSVIEINFSIKTKVYCRPDRNACHLTFNGKDLERFSQLVRPYLIESMKYKLPLDPVTTKSEKRLNV